MSHEIIDNMIAWKGERPWHGLGVEVPVEATGEEMLVLAKLNWKVQRRAIAMRTADGKSTLSGPLAGWKAIVREDTNEVFQVASAKYFPVQNIEIVNYFKEYCEAGHARLETVGGLKGGSVVWALAKLNGGSEGEIGKGDKTEGYMLLATSHDGSVRTIGQATQIRVVCYNTLSASIAEAFSKKRSANSGVFMMKHTRKWTPEVAAEAKKVMGMAIQQVQQTNELGRQLSKVVIDDAGRLEFVLRLMKGESLLDAMVEEQEPSLDSIVDAMDTEAQEKKIGRLGAQILECMVNSPGSDLETAKDTLWGAVNGVTYFSDHVRGKSQDQRMLGAWFTAGNQLKNNAVKLAVQMAGIKQSQLTV